MQTVCLVRLARRAKDARVASRQGGLVVVEQLLVQALSRAEPGHRVLGEIRVKAIELDQVSGQVHDPDGLTHVEDVHLTALRIRSRLQDQANGLTDGHEVARSIRLGDGQGQAIIQLSLEEWHDAAARAEDVAEANGRVRVARPLSGCHGEVLGEPLGRAHDADRLNGLVGRDEHEPGNAEVLAGTQQVARADDVRQRALRRIELDVRDVLQSRGMEDDVGSCPSQDRIQRLW